MLYGKFMLNFLRELPNFSQSGCIIFTFLTEVYENSSVSTFLLTFGEPFWLYSFSWVFSGIFCDWVYFDVEYYFLCLFVICISNLVKGLFKIFLPSLIYCVFFLLLNYKFLCILNTGVSTVILFANTFSQSDLSFHFSMLFLEKQKFLIWIYKQIIKCFLYRLWFWCHI